MNTNPPSNRSLSLPGGPATRCLAFLLLASLRISALAQAPEVIELDTNPGSPTNVRFAILEPLPDAPAPAPTIFVLGGTRGETITKKSFVHAARDYLRAEAGYLVVSLDLPAHGDDVRPGETAGLAGWRSRLAQGENVVAYANARATAVLNYLVANGYTDRTRVAAMGISRGGFLAVHWMASNPNVAAVAAVCPVTKLRYVAEFAGMGPHALTDSLDLEKLASNINLRKPLWLTIGNNDTRVGTDLCISFARAVETATPLVLDPDGSAVDKEVYLRVLPSDNHHQPLNTHPDAADWIDQKLHPGDL